ncbi:hypothetical protein IWQ60_003039 [Tieghemiomyces parasiticus]|uniref:tRNA-5-taurinomethyluridine 2-sulfurtransferase n=1 Tax=Tieghemiomyces parasiticus TaxID=78921 RepID=A0A9W8DV55_9FUNG|nr:hypothetical protein IWQ60_003039 [Tieghemiomyces parasiticus]
MSGGVDSSVVAYLLKKKGYHNLEGVYMRNWDTADERGVCTSEEDYRDVQAVCRYIGIPCRRVDFVKEYWTDVFSYALQAYSQGETPNPDIMCNREIKFGALVNYARAALAGPDESPVWIATGHYARTSCHGPNGQPSPMLTTSKLEPVRLLRGQDPRKDQSYYLSGLSQAQLRRTLFPLGGLHKAVVKDLAREAGLPTASKKESMGICFVGKRRHFADFLGEYLPTTPGPILDSTGAEIGTHPGLYRFTIGQRARIHHGPHKWFVYAKDPTRNAIRVVPGRDHPWLFTMAFTAGNVHWIAGEPPEKLVSGGVMLDVQVRYLQVPGRGLVTLRSDGSLRVQVVRPVRGLAPGQFAVLYDGDRCLGNAVIKSPEIDA